MDDVTPERWLPITGYEGLYEVSDLGRIRSFPRQGTDGRVLKAFPGKYGHLHLTLWSQRRSKAVFVHWVVAEAFIGPRPADLEIRHLDGNAGNNRAINLAYGTSSENEIDKVRHGTHQNSRKTHCPHGHEYSAENTRRDSKGHRWCRACERDRVDRRRKARQEARAQKQGEGQ